MIDIQMDILLYVGSDILKDRRKELFWGVRRVAKNLEYVRGLVSIGQVHLPTFDGAWSLKYREEELMGVEFWDEMDTHIAILAGSELTKLISGKSVTHYFQMQSTWISFEPDPNGRHMFFVRETYLNRRENVRRKLLLASFMQAFITMTVLYLKVQVLLGSKSYPSTLSSWADTLPSYIVQLVDDPDEIQEIISTPLTELL